MDERPVIGENVIDRLKELSSGTPTPTVVLLRDTKEITEEAEEITEGALVNVMTIVKSHDTTLLSTKPFALTVSSITLAVSSITLATKRPTPPGMFEQRKEGRQTSQKRPLAATISDLIFISGARRQTD